MSDHILNIKKLVEYNLSPILLYSENSSELEYIVLKFSSEILATDIKHIYQHPDFYHIVDSKDGISIKSVREMLEKLKFQPFQSKMQICYISHAENLEQESQNTLLKSLEEPNENTLFILSTYNLNSLLYTIQSRCRKLYIKTKIDNDNDTAIDDILDNLYKAAIAKDKAHLFAISESILKISKDKSNEDIDIISYLFDKLYLKYTSEQNYKKLKDLLYFHKVYQANGNHKIIIDMLCLLVLE